MVWTRFRFDDLHTFLLTQLSQDLPYILFDLPIYHHSTIFRRKYYMIQTSPFCVLQAFYVFLSHI